MGEAKKGEGFWAPLAALLPSQGRQSAKLDQARLVLVQRQAKLRQSLLEVRQHLLRIGRAVMSGSLTVGMLVAFLAYKDQFSQRVAGFLDTIIRISLLTVHGERIADVALGEPEEALGASPAMALPESSRLTRAAPALAARGICFRYGDNERDVLADFDFDVAPGECVAIVGPSGAGKTTLLKILAGLLQPAAGSVLLDDVPVKALGLYQASLTATPWGDSPARA